MTEQEAREWREHPLYFSSEKFRAKVNVNGEYEVLSDSGLIATYKPEDFQRHFRRAAQRQVPIVVDKQVSHYEYTTH